MLRRVSLVIAIIAALGVSAVIAGDAVQKDKAKSKDKTESKDKQKEEAKAQAETPGVFAFDFAGAGGYLGVYLEEVTPERAKELGLSEERGAIVMKVVEGSPAEKSGLKENDVVVSFNGRRVDSVRELQRLLSETPADRIVQIEVTRGGSHQTVSTTLAKRSPENFKLLGPDFNEKVWKSNEDAMKRAEEALKKSEEAWKKSEESAREKFKTLPPDFGDFAFVNPGEYSFFGGTRLGINAESLTTQLGEFFGVKDGKGVLVATVTENGPAAKAGIKAGDVIVAVGDDRVDSVRSLMKVLSGKEGTVPVRIVRNHSEQTINVTIEKREAPGGRRRAMTYTRRLATT